MSGYIPALEAAGATVHAEDSFGDYQGTIWALVTYKGETGWAQMGYGSCSYCDAYSFFRDELGWDYDFSTPDGQAKLAEFGREYLDTGLLSQDEAEAKASADLSWDMEAQAMYDFIRAQRIVLEEV